MLLLSEVLLPDVELLPALPDMSELLLWCFLCLCFFVLVPVPAVLLSEVEPELGLMSLPPVDPLPVVDEEVPLPCAELPVPGEAVPVCCATAIPIEKSAAEEIARSFLVIPISYFLALSAFEMIRARTEIAKLLSPF